MHRYSVSILILLFPFITNVNAAEYEQRVITRCISAADGNPTQAAVCAGKKLTSTQITKCINNNCFGKKDEIKKAFISLYEEKLRTKTPCGNHVINTINKTNSVEFSTNKTWALCTGYKVVFQNDGNLVVYNKQGKTLWSSGTKNKGADKLSMQSNGNLVIYKQSYPIWSSGTHGNPGAALAVQEDGNLAIYNRYTKPVWATGTNGM